MTQLTWLDPRYIEFPPIESALGDPNGLLAAGGDLTSRRLVEAYRRGIFPWYEEGQPILWWSPDPRLILLPENIHISKSMTKVIRKGVFTVTADTAFEDVICSCSDIPRDGQSGTWIIDDMIEAYIELHNLGYAHSIEVWEDKTLVGGLYGIAIGAAFFGESMFSKVANASKMALISLSAHLVSKQYQLIDCQMETEHLKSMGAKVISRKQFQSLLTKVISQEDSKHFAPKKWRL